MRQLKSLLFLSISIVLFASFMVENQDSVDLSTIVSKLRYSSPGIQGYGGKLIIENVSTGAILESHSKIGMNPFVIIENVPNGEYIIKEVQIIYASYSMILGDTALFNRIEINEAKNYYVGSYLTKKLQPLLEFNVQVNLSDVESERMIYKQVRKKSENWAKLDIDYSQNLFKESKTVIKFK